MYKTSPQKLLRKLSYIAKKITFLIYGFDSSLTTTQTRENNSVTLR